MAIEVPQNEAARPDLSHHIAARARNITQSSMKALGAFLKGRKDLVSLAGGLPHPSLFPMQHATFTLPTFNSLNGDVTAWQNGEAPTELAHLNKTGPGAEDLDSGVLDLNDVLQYGLSNGFPEFANKLEDLNELLHGKGYSDRSVYVSLGNTDGCAKVFQLFIEPDVDTILVEEYSFASSLNSAKSRGAKLYPVKMDNKGVIPSELEHTLSTWNESIQGRKPHLFYTIPCGQNPTGTIQPQERYDEIYEICQRHDVIIMEDDPYYPLQYRPFQPDAELRKAEVAAARAEMPTVPGTPSEDDKAKVAQIFNDYAGVKSYLSRDVDGRVVRIDTFSKVFGPGIRLGWVTANAAFVERLMRIGETSTQVPSNLSQAVLTEYLDNTHWGTVGFLRWMWGVRLEYQAKRDYFLARLAKYAPSDLVSTTPCGGGMFQWIKVDIASHPRFTKTPLGPLTPPESPKSIPVLSDTLGSDSTKDSVPGLHTKESNHNQSQPQSVGWKTNTSELMDELWQFCVEKGVVLMPAKLFQVDKPDGPVESERLNYFRATFAGDLPSIDKALSIFGSSVKEWFARG